MSLFDSGDLAPCPNPKERLRLQQQRAKIGKRTSAKLLEAAAALQEYMDCCIQLGIVVRLEGDDHRQLMVDSMAEFGRHLKAVHGRK